MAKVQRGVGGSVVLNRHGSRLWPALRSSCIGLRLIDTMRCGRTSVVSSQEQLQRSKKKKEKKEMSDLKKRNEGSERLSELLKWEVESLGDVDGEVKKKMEVFSAFQRVVKVLQFGEGKAKKEAAIDVRRLAKEDAEARVALAMLGAIPPLVSMIDCEDEEFHVASLYALLNLAIGNDVNKAAIVKTGAVHKMLALLKTLTSQAVSDAMVANFLGLTALDSNKAIIGSSGAVPFLVSVLVNPNTTLQAEQDALRALYNLSICASNAAPLLETPLVPTLLSLLGDMATSERSLAILANLSSTPDGRRAISKGPNAFTLLVDALTWADSPNCQESACYIIMMLAHKSWADRQALNSRVFESEKGKQIEAGGSAVAPVSAPICGGGGEGWGGGDMSEERMAVKEMVQLSLQSNMRRIVMRANLPQEFAPSEHFKTVTATSSSKSLPF
ncbi:hypothetical protein AMTR_s00065p00179210 [Amborella trichopoda]|uniref:U-box domain-containing protein n=1 Tax=Amborella trichopoda TaxID=13333 RepID=U5CZ80_AMBTC|nr:hypothetical protein AMTR_s00065p00179210 [Amborella trichopoda]